MNRVPHKHAQDSKSTIETNQKTISKSHNKFIYKLQSLLIASLLNPSLPFFGSVLRYHQ